MSTTTKQVRQVLANELGLSREAVIEIIDERIAKIMQSFSMESLIDKTVRNYLNSMVAENRYDREGIRTLAAKVAGDVVRSQLVITLKSPA